MISVIGIEKNWSQINSLCFIYGDKILISSTLHTPELSVDIKPTGNSGQLAKPVQINLQSQFRSTYLAIQINLLGNSGQLAKPVQVNLLGNSGQLTWQFRSRQLTWQFRSTYLANVCVDFADGGRALAGTDGGRGVEVGRVFAALAAAVQSD